MRNAMKFAAMAVVGLGAGFSASTAGALDLRLGDPIFAYGERNITTVNVAPGDPAFDKTVRTGPFNIDIVGEGARNDFLAWCFEIEQTIGLGTYDYEIGDVLDADQTARVLKLFDANYTDDFFDTNGRNRGVALQTAIWETIYETSGGYSVTNGNFTASGDTDSMTLANTYLENAFGEDVGPIARKWSLTTFASATRQDLGTVNAIPLPAAAWLLLAASGGLLAAKRRRRAA
jgi:hypothetical protein